MEIFLRPPNSWTQTGQSALFVHAFLLFIANFVVFIIILTLGARIDCFPHFFASFLMRFCTYIDINTLWGRYVRLFVHPSGILLLFTR